MKRNIIFTFALVLTLCTTLFAQNEEAFQNYLVKINPILTKSTEELNKSDINLLNEAIALNPDTYGVANKRLCIKIKADAKNKLDKYRDYLAKMKKMSGTLDKLDDETALRKSTELERDKLADENAKLLATIDNLNSQITKYKTQAQKLKRANKKLQDENMTTKDILKNSSALLAQMLTIMPDEVINSNIKEKIPTDILDSLNNTQCAVTQLLKTNFTTSLQSMRTDVAFMDSMAVFYRNNKKYDTQITNYIDATNELIAKLRSSEIECAVTQAAQIENDLNEFLLEIEKRSENISSDFMKFISNNLVWLIMILILLIVGSMLVVSKTKKKNT